MQTNCKNEFVLASINLKLLLRACCLIFLCASCKKFVEIDPPKTQLVTSTVFASDASAIAAQTVIYSQMVSEFTFFLSEYMGLSADEFTNYSTSTDAIQLYRNQLNARNGNIQFLWSQAYKFIYESNAVLEGVSTSQGISPSVRKQLSGEAKFIRAFWNLYLVNLWGDIPLITTTDYTTNSVTARTSKMLVYQQIVADLKDAENLLNDNYVDGSSVVQTNERIRPNKLAAAALLARVYLYMGDWANAEIKSTEVVNNTSEYSLVSDLDNVFLKNSTETIWQLSPVLPGQNTREAIEYLIISNPEKIALSPQILGAFESGDNRKNSWIASTTIGTDTFYYPYKYKVVSSSTVSEYTMVLRLAEMYLIRAEARAQQNNISGSQFDLNIIRNRAGLSNTISNDKSSLLLAIEHERQVELFTELGHRWLDIKRTNRVDAIMQLVAVQKGGTWNSGQQLYPIPQSERNNDPNLTQNAGY